MAATKKIQIYDTTLRDGCQSEDVSLTTEDKVEIARRLDDLGIDYVEGGWPGSNDRDAAFFSAVKKAHLKHSKIAAFGSTRRAGVKASQDRNLQLLLKADTPVATVVGKTWDLHVREALRIPLEENLEILHDTIAFLKKHVDEVIFDAEHFFDGFFNNENYTLNCMRAVDDAGVDRICLCDTNGGRLPEEIEEAVRAALATVKSPIAIHCHNDSEVAVANTHRGGARRRDAGAGHHQWGRRAMRQRQSGFDHPRPSAQARLSMRAACEAEGAARSLDAGLRAGEYHALSVGRHSWADMPSRIRAGCMSRQFCATRQTYEHIDPALVGNDRHVVLSELSGKANIMYKSKELGLDIDPNNEKIADLLEEVKRLESEGYTFEGADASFELLMRRTLGMTSEHFNFVSFRVFDDKWHEDQAPFSEAVVIIEGPDGHRSRTSAIGNGPVNALDSALRSALVPYYPALENMHLADYKVRVLDNGRGTGARVRVLIESTDGKKRWSTVGVSANVVEASWQALVDSVEYKLHKDHLKPRAKPVGANGDNGAGAKPPGKRRMQKKKLTARGPSSRHASEAVKQWA